MATPIETVPGVAAAARKALATKGYVDLESLNSANYQELASLNGVGVRSLERIQSALERKGMSLAGSIPAPEPSGTVYIEGHTGQNAKDIKTAQTAQRPEDFIESLDTERRIAHGRMLLELFNRITGAEPVMWGPSMIGYGQVHYKYATGREGDTFKVGFSPRKAKLSLYGLTDGPDAATDLEQLGKYTVGASCLYINKPEDIDLDVLSRLIEKAWQAPSTQC
ncbi:MAG: DUF1801 domain-containing protein [Gulosibacter sp.]|uniref:DUF1801 domain-containing protein n=1 Tax=Gulosibacter sp. TaxID=2817531 RepID=UPI003F900883